MYGICVCFSQKKINAKGMWIKNKFNKFSIKRFKRILKVMALSDLKIHLFKLFEGLSSIYFSLIQSRSRVSIPFLYLPYHGRKVKIFCCLPFKKREKKEVSLKKVARWNCVTKFINSHHILLGVWKYAHMLVYLSASHVLSTLFSHIFALFILKVTFIDIEKLFSIAYGRTSEWLNEWK